MSLTGMHKVDLLQAIGGSAKCREVSVAFYARVATDTTLRPLFPHKTLGALLKSSAHF